MVALSILLAIVKAIINVLATPWPWLALGAYVLYRVAMRLLAMHFENQVRTAVLEVVAAQLDGDEMRLEAGLDRLTRHIDDPEAAFLLAAHHLQRARFDLASAALKRLSEQDGLLVSPYKLVLQIPGMAAPLALAEQRHVRDVVTLFNKHIGILSKAPATLLTPGVNPPALESHLQLELQREAELERERQARLHAERRATEERLRREAAEQDERLRVEAAEQAERLRRAAAEREARLRREAVEREQAAVERASAKILAAKTSAGRRSALQNGLDAVGTPALRQQLLVLAARAEVDGVMAKAVMLKTTKAKRRHLEDALAALRADDVPDELQSNEIALLEESLAELGQ